MTDIRPPEAREPVPESIRECFCVDCGLVAPSWFHADFMMGGDGFHCIWCCFPKGMPQADGEPLPWDQAGQPKPDGPYVPLPRW